MQNEPNVVWQIAADLVLALHVAFVVFVILGLLLVVTGGLCRWRWVRNPWFRWFHLVSIGLVVAQAWLGVICPLTTWESALRARGGGAAYEGSFIAHWLERLLYFNAPPWVFTVCYTAFGLLVLTSWFLVPPAKFRPPRKRPHEEL